jgi:hypothetical protein
VDIGNKREESIEGEFHHAGEAGVVRIGDLGDWTSLAGLKM